MNWISPYVGLWAAAVAVPLLVALARPVMSMIGGEPKRYVLLIDRSASMNATDESPSRLESAKRQAKTLIDSLRKGISIGMGDQSDQAMVIAFDQHAKVMCNFTSDKGQLIAAVDAIAPTDGPTSLSEAVTVARAFAQPQAGENSKSSEIPAQLELFSDGRIPDAEEIAIAPKELNFHCVGKSPRNVAVTAMQARRSYEKPEEVEVFATLANYGDRPAPCDVQLSLDGGVRAVRAVNVPAAAPNPDATKAATPGKLQLSFDLTHSQAGVVEVRAQPKAEDNLLPSDDAAWAILPPPRNLRVLLVTAGNSKLDSALKASPLVRMETVTPGEFEAMDTAELSANPKHDVIVLDNCTPAKLPRGRFLIFGRPPPGCGITVGGELQNQLVVDWRSRHPVLQYVNLSNLFAQRAWKIVAPSDAQVLAEFASSPALVLLRRAGSVYLLAPFDCMETNWPFETGFVIFCYNAAGYLGLEMGLEGPGQSGLRVNQAISLEGLTAGAKVKVTGPGALSAELDVDPTGAVRFPGTSRVGVYEAAAPQRPPARFAVNLLEEAESSIEPAVLLRLLGQTVEAKGSIGGNTEVWPLLAMLALGLVCLEWFVYKRKVRV